MDNNKLIYALNCVIWYNGLGADICKWKNLEPTGSEYSFIRCPLHEIRSQYSDRDYSNFEIIWMIAVLLFGDYGTSPRSGWITDINGFKSFIDEITKLYREAEGII